MAKIPWCARTLCPDGRSREYRSLLERHFLARFTHFTEGGKVRGSATATECPVGATDRGLPDGFPVSWASPNVWVVRGKRSVGSFGLSVCGQSPIMIGTERHAEV
jgi:hypothetical protein